MFPIIYKILLATVGTSVAGGAVVGGYFAYVSIFKSTENPQTSIEDIDASTGVEVDDITPMEESELDARKEEESLLLSITQADAVATKEASLDLANKEKAVLEAAISASTEKLVELNKQANAKTKIINDNTPTSQGLDKLIKADTAKLTLAKETAKEKLQAFTDAKDELTSAKLANTSAQDAWQIQQTKLTGLTMATTQALSAKNGNATQLAKLQSQYDVLGWAEGYKKRELAPKIAALKNKTTGLENAYQRANTAEQHAKEALDGLQTAKLQKAKEEKDAQSKFDLATSAKSDADTAQAELETNIPKNTNKKNQIDKTIQTAAAAKTKLQGEIDAENIIKKDAQEKLAVQVNLIATLNTELAELKEQTKTVE